MITRRQFSRAALTGLALPALTGRWASASPVGGVRLGVQTYSFREIAKPGGTDSVDIIIGAMKSLRELRKHYRPSLLALQITDLGWRSG